MPQKGQTVCVLLRPNRLYRRIDGTTRRRTNRPSVLPSRAVWSCLATMFAHSRVRPLLRGALASPSILPPRPSPALGVTRAALGRHLSAAAQQFSDQAEWAQKLRRQRPRLSVQRTTVPLLSQADDRRHRIRHPDSIRRIAAQWRLGPRLVYPGHVEARLEGRRPSSPCASASPSSRAIIDPARRAPRRCSTRSSTLASSASRRATASTRTGIVGPARRSAR